MWLHSGNRFIPKVKMQFCISSLNRIKFSSLCKCFHYYKEDQEQQEVCLLHQNIKTTIGNSDFGASLHIAAQVEVTTESSTN